MARLLLHLTGPVSKIQTQVFQALYNSDDNVFVGAPTGSGKTICAEFAILRLWSQSGPKRRCVCIEPYQDVVNLRVAEWRAKFDQLQGGKIISGLTGETAADLLLLSKSDVVVCTPAQWDVLSRRWRQRLAVQQVDLLIADELHLVGAEIGATYEVAVSRARFVSAQPEVVKTRIVAFAVSLANARDLGDWIGAPAHAVFNFPPGARPLPMDLHFQSFNVPHFPSLMIQMARPAFIAIEEWAGERPTIVFVPSRKQCSLTANDLLLYAGVADHLRGASHSPGGFLNVPVDQLRESIDRVADPHLRDTLTYGIGIYHEGLSRQDKLIVEGLFKNEAIRVVVASKDTAWSIPLSAYMVILFGVQTFEGELAFGLQFAIADGTE